MLGTKGQNQHKKWTVMMRTASFGLLPTFWPSMLLLRPEPTTKECNQRCCSAAHSVALEVILESTPQPLRCHSSMLLCAVHSVRTSSNEKPIASTSHICVTASLARCHSCSSPETLKSSSRAGPEATGMPGRQLVDDLRQSQCCCSTIKTL